MTPVIIRLSFTAMQTIASRRFSQLSYVTYFMQHYSIDLGDARLLHHLLGHAKNPPPLPRDSKECNKNILMWQVRFLTVIQHNHFTLLARQICVNLRCDAKNLKQGTSSGRDLLNGIMINNMKTKTKMYACGKREGHTLIAKWQIKRESESERV